MFTPLINSTCSQSSNCSEIEIRSLRRLAALTLIVWMLHAWPVSGQEEPRPKPKPNPAESVDNVADNPRWWTLTDVIAPEELHAIHNSVELHQERRRQATRSGLHERLSESELGRVEFFVDGTTHPELFPLWMAYSSFAGSFAFHTFDPSASLDEFGFAPGTRNTIVDFTRAFEEERGELQDELEKAMKPVSDFARLSKKRLGPASYELAIETKDTRMLASATGYSVERVEKLMSLWWEETPTEDLTVRTLPLLKEALGPEDWELFRRYLLEVQAPKMSASDYTQVVEER